MCREGSRQIWAAAAVKLKWQLLPGATLQVAFFSWPFTRNLQEPLQNIWIFTWTTKTPLKSPNLGFNTVNCAIRYVRFPWRTWLYFCGCSSLLSFCYRQSIYTKRIGHDKFEVTTFMMEPNSIGGRIWTWNREKHFLHHHIKWQWSRYSEHTFARRSVLIGHFCQKAFFLTIYRPDIACRDKSLDLIALVH